MKMFLFNQFNIQLIVKAPNEFMAACYANQWLETRYVFRVETNDAIEIDNDMDFGVTLSVTGGSIELYNSENKFWKSEQVASGRPEITT